MNVLMRLLLFFLVFFYNYSSLLAIEQEVSFAVSDVQGLEDLHRDFAKFKTTVEKLTGIKIKFFPISSRTAAAEAMRRNKLDMILTGPVEYVIISSRAKVKPIVSLVRPEYYSAIITLRKNNFSSLHSLKGKKIGFGDFASTSYYLIPLQMLYKENITINDITPLYLNKNIAWLSLKRGDVAAIGMNYARFLQYRDRDKEVSKYDFKVLARSGDLPSDLIVARSELPIEITDKIKKAFQNNSDLLIKAILTSPRNNKYNDMKFSSKVNDKDYEHLRKTLKALGYNYPKIQ